MKTSLGWWISILGLLKMSTQSWGLTLCKKNQCIVPLKEISPGYACRMTLNTFAVEWKQKECSVIWHKWSRQNILQAFIYERKKYPIVVTHLFSSLCLRIFPHRKRDFLWFHCTVVPSYPQFCFSVFSVTHGQPRAKNIKWKIPVNNECFKSLAFLSSVMKSAAPRKRTVTLCPAYPRWRCSASPWVLGHVLVREPLLQCWSSRVQVTLLTQWWP